jgi:hypothetical protein
LSSSGGGAWQKNRKLTVVEQFAATPWRACWSDDNRRSLPSLVHVEQREIKDSL